MNLSVKQINSSIDNLSELNYYKNFLDNKYENGYVGYESGNIIANDTLCHSDYIKVYKGAIYIIRNSRQQHFAFYNTDKIYIKNTVNDLPSAYNGKLDKALSDNLNAIYFVAPEDGYFRFTVQTQDTKCIMIAIKSITDNTLSVDATDYNQYPMYAVRGISDVDNKATKALSEASKNNNRFDMINKTASLYNLDVVKQYLGTNSVIDFTEVESTYNGTNLWANYEKQFPIEPGEYTLIVPYAVIDPIQSFYIEYIGGKGNSSYRLINQYKSGLYSFIVDKEHSAYNGNMEFRLLLSTTDKPSAGTYGIYGISIVKGNITNSKALPDYITGIGSISKDVSELKEKSVTKSIGKNLFDKNNTTTENCYLSNTGGVMDGSSYTITKDFIPVKPNTTYIMHEPRFGGGFMCFFDKDFKTTPSKNIDGNALNSNGGVFTTPEDCYYIKTTLNKYIDTQMIEEGSTKSRYEEYSFEYAPLRDLKNEVSALTVKPKSGILSAEKETLSAGEYLYLTTDNLDVKKCKTATFSAKIKSFKSIKIGHGEKQYGSTYAVIDNTNITISSYYAEERLIKQFTHGLTLKDYIDMHIYIDNKASAIITLHTNGGTYTTTAADWDGCNGVIYALSIDSELKNCKYSWTCKDLNSQVFVFGDSYLGLTNPARFPYHILKLGYNNWLACAFPGEGAYQAYLSFSNLIKLATPKVCVWCMGMNNPDNGAINSSYKKYTDLFISDCAAAGITPILATIPSTWGSTSEDSDITMTRDNSYKCAYVKESGYRYVDFAKAVIKEDNSGWYDGMLSGDGVHPTESGAFALALQFILDVPEITW